MSQLINFSFYSLCSLFISFGLVFCFHTLEIQHFLQPTPPFKANVQRLVSCSTPKQPFTHLLILDWLEILKFPQIRCLNCCNFHIEYGILPKLDPKSRLCRLTSLQMDDRSITLPCPFMHKNFKWMNSPISLESRFVFPRSKIVSNLICARKDPHFFFFQSLTT